jgi:very-short-patch-repair endonuclease
MGPYPLDFYCAEARLAIELDGFQHYAPEARCHDEKRDAFLRVKGIETLRYSNVRFWREPEIIKADIYRKLQQRAPKAPPAHVYRIPTQIQRD